VSSEHIIQVRDKEFIIGRRTWIMGILNITPDSFSDGGLYATPETAVAQGLKLIAEGADILDVGGESTRPGSDSVSIDEEKKRALPVITELRKQSDILISIDTTKAEVARAALDAGADIINDISAGRFDQAMLGLAAERAAPIILMHMQGNPKTMQNNPYYADLLPEILTFFKQRIAAAESQGIPRNHIIIDPGIGFGKRQEDNLSLLKNLQVLNTLGLPVLIGISRKSFIGRILGDPPAERLEGTIASALIGVLHGAHILRVHDVAAVKKAITVAEAIMHQNVYARTSNPGETGSDNYA
jgi:dihydropteroate synthase